jgi:hypothetical protein
MRYEGTRTVPVPPPSVTPTRPDPVPSQEMARTDPTSNTVDTCGLTRNATCLPNRLSPCYARCPHLVECVHCLVFVSLYDGSY